MKKAKLHIISHTHWDREWYQDFQGFRQRLVYQTDNLLDLLERQPSYRCFHFDGQTSCLLDYLEIRPENRERLATHIQSGRIAIGPWFVMPDELLLSGESLVRNLLLGHKHCDEFGVSPMPVGNVVDVFGHCSQMPQIFKGFHIDAALLHRGTSGEDEKTEMAWEGADGSKLLIIKVYLHTGYCDILHFTSLGEAGLKDYAREYEKNKLDMSVTGVLYGLDGNDHTPARWDLPESLSRLNGMFEQIECVHSTFADYLTELTAALGGRPYDPLITFTGELRTPSKTGMFNEVINGIGSSRLNLKQRNDELEHLLARYAEPLHIWAGLHGGDCQKAFLDLAWKYLFLNHPHDSIVGCSVDQVHRDMMYRFDQARSIALNSIRESIQCIDSGMDLSRFTGCARAVSVFNLANGEAGPALRLSFEIPSEEAEATEHQGLTPVLTDMNGNSLPQQLLRVEKRVRTDYLVSKKKTPYPNYLRDPGMRVHRYVMAAEGSLPALSRKTWGIQYLKTAPSPVCATPVAADPSARSMDNGRLRVSVREDGRIDLFDLETGVSYNGLMYYEDCGDAGNGWNHIYPENDTVVSGISGTGLHDVTAELMESGPLIAVFKVTGLLKIPKGLDETGRFRLAEQTELNITSYLTLVAGEKRLECKTVVKNTAECHRLRAMFPSGRKGARWFADTAFDFVRRDIAVLDTAGWNEQARPESPIKNFMGISDQTGGLALITKGICEGCVTDDEPRTLALTLFRSFTQNLEAIDSVDSQLLGDIVLEYAVVPLAPGTGNADLFAEMERYKYPLLSHTIPVSHGTEKAAEQLAETAYPFVLTTIKAAEKGGGIIIRLFNPLEERAQADLKLRFAAAGVWETDLLEQKQRRLDIEADGTIRLRLRGKQICTLLMEEAGRYLI